jgi:CheY-like chemotaxis protein
MPGSFCASFSAANGSLPYDTMSLTADLTHRYCESFDMLICDIGLPDETGYELMKKIRERKPIKGIAVTAYGAEEDLRKSRDAGFSEHFLKPVELSRLHEAIQRVLASG